MLKNIDTTLEEEHGWPLVWHQNVVDASQLHIDLEAEVGERLRWRLHYVLNLNALCGHAQECVSHTLYLSYDGLKEKE